MRGIQTKTAWGTTEETDSTTAEKGKGAAGEVNRPGGPKSLVGEWDVRVRGAGKSYQETKD